MSKGTRGRKASVAVPRSIPWGSIAAVLAVLVFAGGVFGFVFSKYSDTKEERAALAPFTPSEANPDPSKNIPGMVVKEYKGASHVAAPQQVAYDQNPPFGGPHDQYWATCTGTVYEQPIRSENAVHSLEHGAVWVTYNPRDVGGEQLKALRDRVEGESYTLMSPIPNLDTPISLQSWGHQLKLEGADDPRIGQFIQALRTNRFTHPEVGATCQTMGGFDPDNPPPYQSDAGPNAVPMNGQGNAAGMGGSGAGMPSGGAGQ